MNIIKLHLIVKLYTVKHVFYEGFTSNFMLCICLILMTYILYLLVESTPCLDSFAKDIFWMIIMPFKAMCEVIQGFYKVCIALDSYLMVVISYRQSAINDFFFCNYE